MKTQERNMARNSFKYLYIGFILLVELLGVLNAQEYLRIIELEGPVTPDVDFVSSGQSAYFSLYMLPIAVGFPECRNRCRLVTCVAIHPNGTEIPLVNNSNIDTIVSSRIKYSDYIDRHYRTAYNRLSGLNGVDCGVQIEDAKPEDNGTWTLEAFITVPDNSMGPRIKLRGMANIYIDNAITHTNMSASEAKKQGENARFLLEVPKFCTKDSDHSEDEEDRVSCVLPACSAIHPNGTLFYLHRDGRSDNDPRVKLYLPKSTNDSATASATCGVEIERVELDDEGTWTLKAIFNSRKEAYVGQSTLDVKGRNA